jgi:hypothetical protein
MTSPAVTPDKPEPIPPEIHPHTREILEQSLPGVKLFDNFLKEAFPHLRHASEDGSVNDAVDELRRTFPGLDDLTLAVMCCYMNSAAAHLYRMAGDLSALTMAASYADMALALAWSLDTPETPEPEAKAG